MIEYLKRSKVGEKLQRLSRPTKGCWARVIDPTSDEINFLIKKYGLDFDSVIDGLDIHEVPRFDHENQNAYLFLRLPRKSDGGSASSFLLILTKDTFITVSRSRLGVFEYVSEQDDFLTSDSTKAVLKIMSYISHVFSRHVYKIFKEVRGDHNNLSKLNTRDILDLVKNEDLLNDYVYSFSPLIDMYTRVMKSKSLNLTDDEREIIEDILVDMNQIYNSCKSTLKTISNMRDYYSTSLSHNLNRTLQVLTFFTIFLTVPAVISSIYGMNISLPFQGFKFTFLFIILFVFLIWSLLFLIFRRLGFI